MTLPSGETSNNDEYDTALSQALNGNNTQLDSLSQAPFDDTDEPNENQQSLFDGVAMFDAAKKSKMVLNLFIFDKDGNEIGGDDDEPTNQESKPMTTTTKPQTAYTQADVDYLQQMANGEIALTVENMSEHIAKIEQIAERLGDEHESLIEQAVDKYSEFALSVQVS